MSDNHDDKPKDVSFGRKVARGFLNPKYAILGWTDSVVSNSRNFWHVMRLRKPTQPEPVELAEARRLFELKAAEHDQVDSEGNLVLDKEGNPKRVPALTKEEIAHRLRSMVISRVIIHFWMLIAMLTALNYILFGSPIQGAISGLLVILQSAAVIVAIGAIEILTSLRIEQLEREALIGFRLYRRLNSGWWYTPLLLFRDGWRK